MEGRAQQGQVRVRWYGPKSSFIQCMLHRPRLKITNTAGEQGIKDDEAPFSTSAHHHTTPLFHPHSLLAIVMCHARHFLHQTEELLRVTGFQASVLNLLSEEKRGNEHARCPSHLDLCNVGTKYSVLCNQLHCKADSASTMAECVDFI